MLVCGGERVCVPGLLVVGTIFPGLELCDGLGPYGIPEAGLTEYYIVSAAISALAFWRHRANIVRLVHGKENNAWLKKEQNNIQRTVETN